MNSPEQHNKYLGIAHLAYGGLYTLFTLVMSVFFFFIWGEVARHPPRGDEPPMWFFGTFFGLFLFFFAAMAIPSLIAGYGLLKRKSWAKAWGIVAGVLAAMQFPIGTCVCVYTMWFLLGEQGKWLYDRTPQQRAGWVPPQQMGAGMYGGPPPPPVWGANGPANERQREYVPPTQPPDWRG